MKLKKHETRRNTIKPRERPAGIWSRRAVPTSRDVSTQQKRSRIHRCHDQNHYTTDRRCHHTSNYSPPLRRRSKSQRACHSKRKGPRSREEATAATTADANTKPAAAPRVFEETAPEPSGSTRTSCSGRISHVREKIYMYQNKT